MKKKKNYKTESLDLICLSRQMTDTTEGSDGEREALLADTERPRSTGPQEAQLGRRHR